MVFDPLFFSGRGQKEDPAVNAVVCHSPLSNLGYCRKGSTLSVSVAFQILRAGLFEVKSHYVCVWDMWAIEYFISLPSTKPMSYITGSTHLNIRYSILCFSWVSTWNWSYSSQRLCPTLPLMLVLCPARTVRQVQRSEIFWTDIRPVSVWAALSPFLTSNHQSFTLQGIALNMHAHTHTHTHTHTRIHKRMIFIYFTWCKYGTILKFLSHTYTIHTIYMN